MKPINSLLLLVALALLFMDVSAAEVDATAAKAVAEKFLQSRMSSQMRAGGQTVLELAHAEPATSQSSAVDYYVFNTSDGNAFVIVAGDDRVETQVLAYGDGKMNVAELPCNVKWLLEQYKRQIEFLQSQADESIQKLRRSPARSSISIEPLLTCKWNQRAPYYNQCPIYQDARCLTGCVATAMAQVMYYWKYPAELPALSSFNTPSLNIEVPALPGARLDWDNMIDEYTGYYPNFNYTPEQADAVATLMRYCGQACFMDYTPEASGAMVNDQCAAFLAFGYNEEAVELRRDDYSYEQWNEMLLEDLSAGRPVLYSGSSMDSGHAFVLDGYDDGRYHVNWGWGGSSDGYFILDMLGSGEYMFNYAQDMVHKVYPREDGVAAVLYDFEENGVYYKKNGSEATVVTRDNLFNSYQGTVTIPSTVSHGGETCTVTAIGNNAFRNCQNLTDVEIPGTVRSIGAQAFWNCRSLSKIAISKEIERIGSMAFYHCDGMDRVEIEDMASFASIEFEDYNSSPLLTDAKIYCQGEEVTQLVIPGRAGRISNYAFPLCSHITSLSVGEGVTSIGDYAFYECSSLTRVELPNSLERIGLCAFAFCSGITDITIGDSMKVIDASAFYGCSALKSLTLPATLDAIEYAAFAFCEGIENVEFKGGDVHLDEAAFYACTSMTDLILSPGQTRVGDTSFGWCSGLQHVDLGQSLESIAPYAFYNCSSLTSLTMPPTLSVIEEDAFLGCKGLSQVNISDLGAWCAIDFKSESANPLVYARQLAIDGELVKDLVLPEDLKSIGRNAFAGCTSLESVTIPASVTTIAPSAFIYCNGVSRVNTPSLEDWCAIAFGNEAANPLCSGSHLFVADEEVTSLVIPESVTAVRDFAFSGCEGLTDVTVGDQVTAIGNRAFYNCGQLARASVGDGVKSIGEGAFSYCMSLTGVSLGSSIESIATKAFTQSMSIIDITSKAVTPPVLAAKDCFPLIVYKKAALTVPGASVEDYRNASFWSQFKNVAGAQTDHVTGDVNLDGEVTVADINATIQQCYATSPDMTADVNGDGEVNIADVNAVIHEILTAE